VVGGGERQRVTTGGRSWKGLWDGSRTSRRHQIERLWKHAWSGEGSGGEGSKGGQRWLCGFAMEVAMEVVWFCVGTELQRRAAAAVGWRASVSGEPAGHRRKE